MVGPCVTRFFLNAENELSMKIIGALLNVLGVLGVLNVLNVINVLTVLHVLNNNMPMDASLACWALLLY